MEQLGLTFTAPRRKHHAEAGTRARRRDPSTSQAAAARVDEFAAEHYQRILRALSLGPADIYQIAERAGITHVQAARRLPEMLGKRVRLIEGLVHRSPSGRSCRVWALI